MQNPHRSREAPAARTRLEEPGQPAGRARTRLLLSVASCGIFLAAIAALFWYQDWRYSLPTPRPANLVQPAVGAAPKLAARLASTAVAADSSTKPLLLHFLNPDCPCSRFNASHLRELARTYERSVDHLVVIESRDNTERLLAAYAGVGISLEAIVDTGAVIAERLGVYATPQAVLLDEARRTRYRGNYNTSRFCSDPATQFVRIAVDSLLAGAGDAGLHAAASVAYGCPVPGFDACTVAQSEPY